MVSSRKSVLFVINSFARGGAERAFLTDIQILQDEGFDVSVVTLYKKGVLAKELTLKRGEFYELNATSLSSAVRKVRDVFMNGKFEIVVSTLNEANAVSRVASLFLPVVLFTREANMATAKGIRYRLADILFGFRSNYIIAVSHAVGASVTTYAPWLSRKVRVLYNGVEVPDVLARESGAGTKLLTVGSLTPKKDQRILIDAVSLLPEAVTLTLVGEGREREALETRVREKSLEGRVLFTGALSHEETMTMYEQHDIFVLPSLYEGCPNVISEAQSKGMPSVSFLIPGIKEFVSEESGMVVAKRSDTLLAQAISKLVYDAVLRKRLGQSGFNEVKRTRSLNAHKSQLLALLSEA